MDTYDKGTFGKGISISLGFIFLFLILLAVTMSKYRFLEMLHEIKFYLTFIKAVIYLLLKNYFLQGIIAKFFCIRQKMQYKQEIRKLCGISISYYAIWLIFLLIIRNKVGNILWLVSIIAVYNFLDFGIFLSKSKLHIVYDYNN